MAEMNRNYRPGYYYGNTAPKIEEVPSEEARLASLRAAKARVESRVRENRRVRSGLSGLQTLTLVVSLVVFLAATSFYLLSAFQVETNVTAIQTLKKSIQKTEREIEMTEEKIRASIDLDEIYAFAIENGLGEPEKHQIIHYSPKSAEYVIRTAEIPNE